MLHSQESLLPGKDPFAAGAATIVGGEDLPRTHLPGRLSWPHLSGDAQIRGNRNTSLLREKGAPNRRGSVPQKERSKRQFRKLEEKEGRNPETGCEGSHFQKLREGERWLHEKSHAKELGRKMYVKNESKALGSSSTEAAKSQQLLGQVSQPLRACASESRTRARTAGGARTQGAQMLPGGSGADA